MSVQEYSLKAVCLLIVFIYFRIMCYIGFLLPLTFTVAHDLGEQDFVQSFSLILFADYL